MILFVWMGAAVGYVLCGVSTYIIRVPRAYRRRLAAHKERRCFGSCQCQQVGGHRRQALIPKLARSDATTCAAWAATLWPLYLAGYAAVIGAVALWDGVVMPIHRRAWQPVEDAEKAQALRERADKALLDNE